MPGAGGYSVGNADVPAVWDLILQPRAAHAVAGDAGGRGGTRGAAGCCGSGQAPWSAQASARLCVRMKGGRKASGRKGPQAAAGWMSGSRLRRRTGWGSSG